MTMYRAEDSRYETMRYRRSGKSGLRLPEISLGLWHNFGGYDSFENGRSIVLRAFDRGITHFDLANNYGPPPGSAESFFGAMMDESLRPYRDEFIVSTKAGYTMWGGPYGDWGSRKYLVASCEQSLKRMKLDYVDIFYHHRPDPETPLEETVCALSDIVDRGKALYIGLSKYPAKLLRRAAAMLAELRVPLIAHQVRYNLLDRAEVEQEQLPAADEAGLGTVVFSPLAQGVLTNKYADGVPVASRAAKGSPFIERYLHDECLTYARRVQAVAQARGQTPAQTALAWTLRDPRVASAVTGASRVEQIRENVAALENLAFEEVELAALS